MVVDTVSSQNGCDTVRTINVTTKPLNTVTVDTVECENSFPQTIFGHVFTAAGCVVDTVSSQNGCDTVRTINVTTKPLNTVTVDTVVCENSFPQTIFGHVFTAAGSVVDTVSSQNGCDKVRSINVTNRQLNTVTVDTVVCENSFPQTIFGHVFTAAGSVVDTVSSQNGCDTVRTINVTTKPLNTVTVDTVVCENSFPQTIFGHVFTAAGSVVDTVSSQNGCDTVRTINVTTKPLNTVTVDT